MYHDAVSSYALIKRYRSTEYAISNSGWTLMDAAEQIFVLSKQRVYNGQNGEFAVHKSWLSQILSLSRAQNSSRSRAPSGRR